MKRKFNHNASLIKELYGKEFKLDSLLSEQQQNAVGTPYEIKEKEKKEEKRFLSKNIDRIKSALKRGKSDKAKELSTLPNKELEKELSKINYNVQPGQMNIDKIVQQIDGLPQDIKLIYKKGKGGYEYSLNPITGEIAIVKSPVKGSTASKDNPKIIAKGGNAYKAISKNAFGIDKGEFTAYNPTSEKEKEKDKKTGEETGEEIVSATTKWVDNRGDLKQPKNHSDGNFDVGETIVQVTNLGDVLSGEGKFGKSSLPGIPTAIVSSLDEFEADGNNVNDFKAPVNPKEHLNAYGEETISFPDGGFSGLYADFIYDESTETLYYDRFGTGTNNVKIDNVVLTPDGKHLKLKESVLPESKSRLVESKSRGQLYRERYFGRY